MQNGIIKLAVAAVLSLGLSACGSVNLPSLGGSKKVATVVDPELEGARKAAKAEGPIPSAPTTTAAATTQTASLTQNATAAPATPAKPKKSDPLARPLTVAATSVRASKCGFYFDAAKLRDGYIAHERGIGSSEQRIAVLTRIHDAARARLTKQLAEQDTATYCNPVRIAKTRLFLKNYMSGNYAYEMPKKQKKNYAEVNVPTKEGPLTNAAAFGETFQPESARKQ